MINDITSNIVEEDGYSPSVFHYIPNFVTKEEEKELFKYLENINDFYEKPKMSEGFSRLQKWYQVDQKYFCPLWKERYPQWTSCKMDDTINNLIAKIQHFTNDIPNINNIPNINSCLINKYQTGENFIAPHRDSPLSFGEEPVIIGLSIGQKRLINFHRNEKKSGKDFSFELESGSLFIMAGSSQRFYQHSIDKCDCKNVRYSLTFREFIL
jgi:alkylated DNA repair dioxygenase AlkB